MGRLVARALAPAVDLVLAGREPSRLADEAREIGARTASLNSPFTGAEAVVLVLPGEVTPSVLKAIAPLIPTAAVVINVATGVMRKDLVGPVPAERLAGAKIVSQYYDLRKTGAALVVVDGGSPSAEETAARLMRGCGPVISGNEAWVLTANRLAAEEGVRAAIRIQRRLAAAGVPERIAREAVTAVAVGCMRSFVDGNLGPFGQAIAERVEAELE